MRNHRTPGKHPLFWSARTSPRFWTRRQVVSSKSGNLSPHSQILPAHRHVAPVPGARPSPGADTTQLKVGCFSQRTNQRQFGDARKPFRYASPWHPLRHALVGETKTAWEAVLGICRGGKGPQGRASGRKRVTRRGEVVLIKTPVIPSCRLRLWLVGSNVKTPANEGLYPSPTSPFSRLLHLGNTPAPRLPSVLSVPFPFPFNFANP